MDLTSRRALVRARRGRGVLATLGAFLTLGAGAGFADEVPHDRPLMAAPLEHSILGEYLTGRFAYSVSDLGTAATMLSQVLASDPNNVDLLREVYVLMASEGRTPQAVDLAKRLKGLEKDASHGALTLAMDAVERGDFAAADAQLETLPTEGPNQYVVPLLRAWLALGMNKPDLAQERLSPLANLEDADTLYHLHAALVADLAGNAAVAEAHYKEMVTDGDLPYRLTQVYGNFLQRQGRVEEARKLYADYREANPDSPLLPLLDEALAQGAEAKRSVGSVREGLAESLYDLGDVLFRGELYQVSLLFTRLALQMRPDFAPAQVLIADLLRAQGRLAEALAAYGPLALQPGYSWAARLSSAETLEDLDRKTEARDELEKMVAEAPERYDAAVALGRLLSADEKYEDAAKAYDVAIQRIGKLEQRHWSVFYSRGIARERTHRWEDAEADFKKALELRPDQPLVLNYLAYTWAEKGQNLDQALDMLKKAVELRPEDGYITDSLGWVYYRLGRYDEAVEQLERAIELVPEDPVLNEHLGDVYWKLGRKREAQFQWRRALSADPEADRIQPIQAKIEKGLPDGAS